MIGGFSGLMGGGDAESGGASGGSSEIGAASSSIPDNGGGGGGVNRWPRQETLALLKIRSEMDGVFRDSSLKGPLWEDVSRKMGELGFQRNAKKCKEKFENVYKYHKRTKDGRSSKSQSNKTYRYSDQLQALEALPPPPPHPPPSNLPPARLFSSNTTSSSSTSSDEDDDRRGKKRKRKWKTFFKKLMSEVIQKQEHLQKTFLECLEKRERDRIEREEAWRVQEQARSSREHELLVKERSLAAAKDAAVIDFLKKVTGDELNLPIPISIPPIQDPIPAKTKTGEKLNSKSNANLNNSTSSSRWPKAEVEALINLRTNLDLKYGESSSTSGGGGGGPKGPLWEEISASMAELGYSRSSKRCKEKWENINKYFKKVKEGNRKRSEDGKTCPYFHQLDAIYRQRETKSDLMTDNLPAIMARSEKQWPEVQAQVNSSMPDGENGSDDGGDEDDEYDHESVADK